jgi:hypothetical protein
MGPTSIGSFFGAAVEIMAAKQAGAKHEDGIGYDYIDPKYGRVEVKSTFKVQKDKTLRIASLLTKENRCDYFQIYDLYNGRAFRIPHDIMFKGEMWLYEGYNELRWSASYNKTDSVQERNTKIMQEYEIAC